MGIVESEEDELNSDNEGLPRDYDYSDDYGDELNMKEKTELYLSEGAPLVVGGGVG